MTRFGYTLTILFGASLGVAACTDNIDGTSTPPSTDPPPSGSTSGSDDNTFDHDNSGISVWDLIDRLTKEGPPSFSSQMHGCTKPRNATLKNILTSVGVAFPATPAAGTAAQLFNSGAAALGGPNYGARVRENISVTTSGASREFDIFASAATEVIAAFTAGTLTRCNDAAGTPAVLFDASNQCQASGITCIIGVPATPDHVALCNQAVTQTVAGGSSVDFGKRIAVASMLAAAYTCE
ncbi:MAG TPA: hypothetical protein VHW23_29755 [Kofleriaceae bacterium]|jgi:hypothetical protein|nr:hypothetical protein [Kofleriaceae bacterium]